jgi:hypothetical protein
MLRVLEHIAGPDSPDVIPDALPTFVNSVTELSASNRTLRRAMGWELVWARNKRHRLGSIFAIAARWGTTPLDILLRPEEAVTPSLFQGVVDLPAVTAKRPANKKGYQRCERMLQRLLRLSAATPLPPFREICRECVVCESNFQSKNWNLCRRYVAERRCRAESARTRGAALASRYATKLLRDLRTSGKRLHRKRAVASMMNDIHVSKSVARSALRVAVAQLGVDREKQSS